MQDILVFYSPLFYLLMYCTIHTVYKSINLKNSLNQKFEKF